MAELLGVVAGGAGLASLAVQLVDSAEKLRSFCRASKNASQSINDLIFDIETLSLSLRHLERHQARGNNADSVLLERCVVACRSKAAQISDLVARMELKMRNFDKLGKLYVAFKEPEVKKLVDDMERAKSSIHFAYIMYCQSLSMRESESRAAIAASHHDQLATHTRQLDQIYNSGTLVSQQIALLVSTAASTPRSADVRLSPDDRQDDQQPQNVTKSGPVTSRISRRQNKTLWRLRLALPFRAWAWDIAVEVGGSLTVHVRPFNIRPRGCAPFLLLERGDLEAVRGCLANRQLSVWDRDEQGRSMLQYAAESLNMDLLTMLLREDPNLHDSWNMDHLFAGGGYQYALRYGQIQATILRDLLLLCIKHGMDVNFGTWTFAHLFRATLPGTFMFRASNRLVLDECVDAILRNQYPPIETLSFERRFNLAMRSDWGPSRFLSFITHHGTSNLCVTQRTDQGTTALHWLAEHWGTTTSGLAGPTQDVADMHREYGSVMRKLLLMGADPSAPDAMDRTPLCAMRIAFARGDRRRGPVHYILDILQQWSRALEATGHGLGTYIAIEQSLHEVLVITHHNVHRRVIVDGFYHDVVRSCVALECHTYTIVHVRNLSKMPGQFPRPERLPRHIIWNPTADECEEGHWSTVQTLHLHGPVRSLHYLEPCPRVLRQSQDDHSPLTMMRRPWEPNKALHDVRTSLLRRTQDDLLVCGQANAGDDVISSSELPTWSLSTFTSDLYGPNSASNFAHTPDPSLRRRALSVPVVKARPWVIFDKPRWAPSTYVRDLRKVKNLVYTVTPTPHDHEGPLRHHLQDGIDYVQLRRCTWAKMLHSRTWVAHSWETDFIHSTKHEDIAQRFARRFWGSPRRNINLVCKGGTIALCDTTDQLKYSLINVCKRAMVWYPWSDETMLLNRFRGAQGSCQR